MNDKLLETVADIAYIAGQKGHYSGDSRADIVIFIWWAEQFERIHEHTNWDEENYMLAIEAFAEGKLALAKNVACED